MIDIVYLDNHLLAAIKPPGIPSQSASKKVGFDELCRQWLKEQTGKPGNVFLHAIHRIDTPASGIVLFARTSKALSRVQQALREFKVERKYFALVEGKLPSEQGTLEHYLLHDEKQRKSVISLQQGKLSSLHYTVKNEKEGKSLVEIQLFTGRYHQIRSQLSAIGYPILGDTKYGSTTPFTSSRSQVIALFHAYLKLPHPTQNRIVEITAPLPQDFQIF